MNAHKPSSTSKPLSGRVLISGGAGFLGSWLSEALLERGLTVTCIDNLSTGLRENLSHLLPNKAFTFIQQRVEEPPPSGAFHYVLHFASRPSPDDYTTNPVETLTPNAQGVMNMLEVARKNDAVFFLASTSEVYGDAQVIPTPEDYWGYVNPLGLRSCYDEGKRFAEAVANAYQREYGLDVRIMRIFNVYGPRMRGDGLYARVVPIFIRQAVGNEPLTIHGDGSQTRSFTYVTDWLDATLLALAKKEARNQVLNVGSDTETRIIDLAKTIISLTGSRSDLRFLPKREDDPYRRRPDIAKARHILGWTPRTGLKQGLKKTIEWFTSRQSGK